MTIQRRWCRRRRASRADDDGNLSRVHRRNPKPDRIAQEPSAPASTSIGAQHVVAGRKWRTAIKAVHPRLGSGLVMALTAAFSAATLIAAPTARADVVAYLVNVTVRPGYNFASADAAIQYGQGVCGKIADGKPYTAIVGDINSDFNTSDGYQANYLVSQAVNELCPALIWQLRNSAAQYRPVAP